MNYENGGGDATTFERMIADLAQWFLDSPTTTWRNDFVDAVTAINAQEYVF